MRFFKKRRQQLANLLVKIKKDVYRPMSNLQVEQSQPVTKEFSIKAILPVILALITGMLLVMLDSTIMNVAIPQLEKTFDASLKTIQW